MSTLVSQDRGQVVASVEQDGVAQTAQAAAILAAAANDLAALANQQGITAEQRADTAITDAALALQTANEALAAAGSDEKLSRAGGTMTGYLTLHADPVMALHAASKSYVDFQFDTTLSNYYPKAELYTKAQSDLLYLTRSSPVVGGGPLTLAQDGTLPLHAVTKQQAEASLTDAIDTHTQPISRVTGLQSALDGKAAALHSHVASDVSGLGNIVGRNVTVSLGNPSGGSNGDLWLKV